MRTISSDMLNRSFNVIRDCLFLTLLFTVLSAIFFWGGGGDLKIFENAFQYGTFIVAYYIITIGGSSPEEWFFNEMDNRYWSAYCFITIFILLSLGWFFTTIAWTVIWLIIHSENKQNQIDNKKAEENYGGSN